VSESWWEFAAYDFRIRAVAMEFESFELGFSAAGSTSEAWIGLVEGVESEPTPAFWVADGRYYLDGLEVMLPPRSDMPETQSSWPEQRNTASTLNQGNLVLAYLEAWERLVTHVEDQGIREVALGGLDTTVRTEALGQVKLARTEAALRLESVPLDQVIRAAFTNIDRGAGRVDVRRVDVLPAQASQSIDPCAIPTAGGYFGGDNRLYRLEVHIGGNLGTAQIKWSRNNGAELFSLKTLDPKTATATLDVAAPDGGLQDGDLVEMLSEETDLGDACDAQLLIEPVRFVPAERKVIEPLFLVKAMGTPGQIQLLDRLTGRQAEIDEDVTNQHGLKLRRWDDLIATAPPPSPNWFSLGDGLEVEISGGDFRAGDYWQFEARKLGNNANGQWLRTAHGPERLFAPLALLQCHGANKPLSLEAWLDQRFPSLCGVEADDVAYDGAEVGVVSETAQEAIDLLFRRGALSAFESVAGVFAKPSSFYDQPVAKGSEISFDRLCNGLRLEAAQDMNLGEATEADCQVVLEMPYPRTAPDAETWGAVGIGTQPIALSGTVAPGGGGDLLWLPAAHTADWLRNKLPDVLGRPTIDFFSSSDKDKPKWSVDLQHQLVYAGSTPVLNSASAANGAAVVLRRAAVTDSISMQAYWGNVLLPAFQKFQTGLIYDWRSSAEFSMLLYQAEHCMDTGSWFVSNYTNAYLFLVRVEGGVVRLMQPLFTGMPGVGISEPHPPFTLAVSPRGVELSIAEAPPFAGMKFQTGGATVNPAGCRIGAFTTTPVEVWELEDGVQSLQSEHGRVRARLELRRGGARWTGGQAAVAPFIPNFETWFWLRVGWPIPYGSGWVGSGPRPGWNPEYPGIGAELLR
jgi:hypothetical protein